MTEYPQIGVRIDKDLLKRLDEWRREEEDLPSRPEAIRRLIEMGLTVKRKAKK
jgi:metal-responsive CopG/Arc/MetJ family transcriptional regulator